MKKEDNSRLFSFFLLSALDLVPYSKPCLGHNFVCVEVLRPSQPNGVMSSAVSLPYHTFTGQA